MDQRRIEPQKAGKLASPRTLHPSAPLTPPWALNSDDVVSLFRQYLIYLRVEDQRLQIAAFTSVSDFRGVGQRSTLRKERIHRPYCIASFGTGVFDAPLNRGCLAFAGRPGLGKRFLILKIATQLVVAACLGRMGPLATSYVMRSTPPSRWCNDKIGAFASSSGTSEPAADY